MKIAVLFDGAGLARLGLEQSGHECTGYELDPAKHHLSKFVGSGNCILGDVRDFDYSQYDAIWASPPCQNHSDQKMTDKKDDGLLDWSLNLLKQYPDKIIWIENVISKTHDNSWGKRYNAAQFLEIPLQQRRRIIGGNYKEPFVFRHYKAYYRDLDCPPAVMANELFHGGFHKDVNKERRKFSKWYKLKYDRYPTLDDMAKAQGFIIPDKWFGYDRKQQSQAIGNGVPVYMAKAFGDMYSVD